MNNTEKDDILKNVGRRIQEYRQKARLTQEALSEMTGISQKHLSRLEQGRHNPHFDMIIKIAKALNVPIDAFAEDLSETNTNIFLRLIEQDVAGMSQKQLNFLREEILLIKKTDF